MNWNIIYIVFWKGDPKVLETQSSEYLHKNLMNMNFSLYSKLLLYNNLNHELLNPGETKTMIL